MGIQNVIDIGDYRVIAIVSENSWKENCYVICHLPSGEQVLIDPGGSSDLIIQTVIDTGNNLQHVLLTHSHHDHIGAAAVVCRHFNLACELHEGDVRLLRHAPMYSLRFDGKNIEKPESILAYNGQSSLRLGSLPIGIIHSPGHTQGSVCYSLGSLVFTGDTLLYNSTGRTDLPGGDARLLPVSVSRLLEQLPPDAVLFPGHGCSWTLAEARVWWMNRDVSHLE